MSRSTPHRSARRAAPRSAAHALAATLALAALAACGEDAPEPDELVTGKSGVAEAYEVNGYVSAIRNGPLIEGARVCIVDEEGIPCGVSDAAGHYAMRVPIWKKPRELAVHVTAPGYLPFAGMIRRSPTFDDERGRVHGFWQHSINLLGADATAALLREWQLGTPSAERGLVLLDVWYRFTGAPVTLSPESGLGAVSQTVNVSENGQALFAEVPPGRFEVAVAGCTPKADGSSVWRARAPGAVAGLAVAGALTRVKIECEEKEPAGAKRAP